MKPKYIVGVILALLLAAAGLYLYGGGQTPAGQPPLQNLSARDMAEIKNEFNAAKDNVRVLLPCRQLDRYVCRGPLHSIT